MKNKILDTSSLPPRLNSYMPLIIYTVIDYWQQPVWIFAVYMTVWIIEFLVALGLYLTSDKVQLNDILKWDEVKHELRR